MNKKKISWGVKIAVVYTLFALLIMTMVIIFMNQDVNLVEEDYYPKEIAYQQHIDKLERTKKLFGEVSVSSGVSEVIIKFPENINSDEITGNINFYRPSDKTKDFSKEIALSKNGKQIIPTNKFVKGLWKVKIDWKHSGTSYYNESTIMVN